MDNKKELLAKISVLKKMTDIKDVSIICSILEAIIKETNKEIMGFKADES